MKVIEKTWKELKIEKEIGKGAYGNVYRCKDSDTGEYSAVKVITVPGAENGLAEFASEKMTYEQTQAYYKELADDLVKEIEILKSLKGTKNIVEIYDAKVVEKEFGIGWYILIRMELLTEFKTYSANKEFGEADVLKLGADLCSALSVCHKAKILHRDIKPENIFVDSEGNYKLGDFGVAKQMEKTQGSMSIKGTFNYMSPEVFTGKKCDARADLYSLAIVMYKLLNNNRMPFIDKDKESVRYSERQHAFEKRMHGDNIPPVPGVSSEINMIILKACAFNPVDRYRTADEFALQIQQVINGQKIKKSFRKSLIMKIVASVVAVSVLLSVAGYLWYDAVRIVSYDEYISDYSQPDYVTAVPGETSVKSIDGKYIYYGDDAIYIVSDKEYTKVTDFNTENEYGNVSIAKPEKVFFNGEKVCYMTSEANNDNKFKNTLYEYSLDSEEIYTEEVSEEYKGSIESLNGETVYYCLDLGDNKYDLYYYDFSADAGDRVESKIDAFVKIYDNKYLIHLNSVSTIPYGAPIVENKKQKSQEISKIWYNRKETQDAEEIFYKDDNLYFVEKNKDNKLILGIYDFKTEDIIKKIDLYSLGVSSEAQILVMNDKYALIEDGGVKSIVTYGADKDKQKAKIEPLYQKHLDRIGGYYEAFIDSEISDGIILSAIEEDAYSFYTILENGKLAYIGKTYKAGYEIKEGLVYKNDTENFDFEVCKPER